MYSEREGRGRSSPRERKRGTSRGTLSRDRTAACRTLARSTRADVAGNSAVANKAHLTSGVVGGRWSVDGHGVLLLSLARPRGSGCSLGVLGAGCCVGAAHTMVYLYFTPVYTAVYTRIYSPCFPDTRIWEIEDFEVQTSTKPDWSLDGTPDRDAIGHDWTAQ